LTDAESPRTLMLLFRARGLLCALPIERLIETMRPLPVAPFPARPSFVLGVARIRGNPVPVVDLGALLGSPESPHPTRFLTLRLEDRTAALAVEEVAGVRGVEVETLSQLPPLLAQADRQAVAAVGTLDTELLLSLESTRIVPASLWAAFDDGRST
jgi:purine-binding chemotaxis protein CheW